VQLEPSADSTQVEDPLDAFNSVIEQGDLSHLERITRTRWPGMDADQLDSQYAFPGGRLSLKRQTGPITR
jgi:hypothetical protein